MFLKSLAIFVAVSGEVSLSLEVMVVDEGLFADHDMVIVSSPPPRSIRLLPKQRGQL
jgi:hypothetical protein